jgi:hypothetical protein
MSSKRTYDATLSSAEAAIQHAYESLSENTRKSYASAMRQFKLYCFAAIVNENPNANEFDLDDLTQDLGTLLARFLYHKAEVDGCKFQSLGK